MQYNHHFGNVNQYIIVILYLVLMFFLCMLSLYTKKVVVANTLMPKSIIPNKSKSNVVETTSLKYFCALYFSTTKTHFDTVTHIGMIGILIDIYCKRVKVLLKVYSNILVQIIISKWKALDEKNILYDIYVFLN